MASSPVFLKSASDYESLLLKYDTWMFDCSGVLWEGDVLIDGAADVLRLLRKHNKRVIFVTNNARKSRKSLQKTFEKLGVDARGEEIFGSAYAAAVYISSVLKLPKDKKVYVIGQDGLEAELDEEGVQHIGGTDPEDLTPGPFSLDEFNYDPDVGAVVCGLDMSITYTKYAKAFQYLSRNPDCKFIATNIDSIYPAGGGLLPGAGSIFAPLRYALDREPISIGKPSQVMLDCIRAKQHYDPGRTIMVGDRLNTDILFGQKGDLATLLVLSGITQLSEISGPDALPVVPDYVTNSIGDLRVLSLAYSCVDNV